MICFLPTKFAQPKSITLTKVLQIDEYNPPETMPFKSLLTSRNLMRLDVYVQNAKQALVLKQRAYYSYYILCAIVPDMQVARACAGLVDLIQGPMPYATDMAYLCYFGTFFEYRVQRGANLGELNNIKRFCRGKSLIITAPEMSALGLQCLLEQFGFKSAGLLYTYIELLRNAGARVHRAVDGVGFY